MTTQLTAALRALAAFTVLLGLAYPLLVTGLAQVIFDGRADGSVVEVDGQAVGSTLLGQAFTDVEGRALAEYFQTRPSTGGHDPQASGASNLGPENPELLEQVCAREAEVGEREGVEDRRRACAGDSAGDSAGDMAGGGVPAEPTVPPDAVTASGSGLDPHISPAYAALQVQRVATARGLEPQVVRRLVAEHTRERTLGVLGEPRVDVLQVNLALDRLR